MYASTYAHKSWTNNASLDKRLYFLFRNALFVLCSVYTTAHAETVTLSEGALIQTCFSYTHQCKAEIIQLISHAKERILLAGYSFTSNEIAKALRNAHERGIKVQLVLDKSNLTRKHSQTAYLAHAGGDVRINDRYATMHHKFIIVDQAVGLGSMNFARAVDQKNAENFNIFRRIPKLVHIYEQEFTRLYHESKPYPSSL